MDAKGDPPSLSDRTYKCQSGKRSFQSAFLLAAAAAAAADILFVQVVLPVAHTALSQGFSTYKVHFAVRSTRSWQHYVLY